MCKSFFWGGQNLHLPKISTCLADDPVWVNSHGDNGCLSPCTYFPTKTRDFTLVSHPKTHGCCKQWGHKTRFVFERRSDQYEQIIFIIEQYPLKKFRVIRHVVGMIFC